MDFCRVFVTKDDAGNPVERPVLLCHTSESGALMLPLEQEPAPQSEAIAPPAATTDCPSAASATHTSPSP